MNDIFNNRELAVAVWSSLLFAWAFTKLDVIKAFGSVLSSFFQFSIISSFIVAALYTLGAVMLLNEINLWNTGQLKNTIMWFIFIASVEIFKSNKFFEKKHYFRNLIKSHFTLLAIFEFIVAFHSFSFGLELIIVPASALLSMTLVVAETKVEHKRVHTIISWLLSILGIFMLIYGVYYILDNFSDFAKIQTLMNFLTPILLSLFFIPFIVVFSIYILYESILTRIHTYTDNKSIRRYAKIKAILRFKHDHESISEWLAYSCIPEFTSKETVDESINNFEKRKQSA